MPIWASNSNNKSLKTLILNAYGMPPYMIKVNICKQTSQTVSYSQQSQGEKKKARKCV